MGMPTLDQAFVMWDGFVLNFSNRTFAELFREKLQVNVDGPCWEVQGERKAKRLRHYLRRAERRAALDTLHTLWEYPETSDVTHDYPALEETVAEWCSTVRRNHRGSRSC